MQIDLDTPQRVAIVIEKNKSDNWSVAAYLVRADGLRDRRKLATCDSYVEAVRTLKRVWQHVLD